jgi:hypothetical protein
MFEFLVAAALVTAWILPNHGAVRADDAKPPQKEQPFTISLPKGDVSIELIGICSSPREGRRWWRPDGTPLEIEPCKGWSNSYAGKWAEDRSLEAKKYEIALRITYKGTERATTKWKFMKGGRGWLDIGHKPGPDIRSVFVAEYANVDAIDFKVAIATGPWQTDCTYPKANHRADFAPRESAGFAVIWQRPVVPEENYPGRTKLNVIHDFTDEYETRVLLSDIHGAIHKPVQTKSNRARNLTVFRAYYDPGPELIEEFQLQIRPLYWIQFRNVSLRPGFKTKPEIRLCESAEADKD